MTVQTMDTITTTAAPQEQQAAATEQSTQQAEQHQEGQEQGAQQQPSEGKEQAEGEGQQQQQKKVGVQKRIDELTRAKHEAEREARYWREQHTAKQGAPSSQDAPKPARADFADDAGFIEAMADWKAEQKLSAHKQQTAAERQNEAEANHNATRFELYQQRVADSAEAMPDYAEVVGKSDVPAHQHVLESILDSDHGPALAYHLAKNPDVAQQLNDMTPIQAAKAIGRLEVELAQAKPAAQQQQPQKRTTNAPAPITPVRGGNGQFAKPAEAQSDAEWYASRKS